MSWLRCAFVIVLCVPALGSPYSSAQDAAPPQDPVDAWITTRVGPLDHDAPAIRHGPEGVTETTVGAAFEAFRSGLHGLSPQQATSMRHDRQVAAGNQVVLELGWGVCPAAFKIAEQPVEGDLNHDPYVALHSGHVGHAESHISDHGYGFLIMLTMGSPSLSPLGLPLIHGYSDQVARFGGVSDFACFELSVLGEPYAVQSATVDGYTVLEPMD